MSFLRNIKIGVRLTIWFFLIAFLSISVIGYFSYDRGKESLEKESFNRLTAVREMKANQIEEYFELINYQILTLSNSPTIVQAMKDFNQGFHSIEDDLQYSEEKFEGAEDRLKAYYQDEFLPRLKGDDAHLPLEEVMTTNPKTRILQDFYIASNRRPVGSKDQLIDAKDSSSYTEAHKTYHKYFHDYQQKFGYYDIFLVDEDGHIVYTVFKEIDFGTSLVNGPFSTSNIAKAYNKVIKATNYDFQLVDYEPYVPSYAAPAAFIAAPIYDGINRIGVLIFQLPIDRIDNIMTSNQNWSQVGLGESGETYIVGEDYLLRNQSRFLIEDSTNYFKMISDLGTPKETIKKIRRFNSTIGLQEVKTKGTEAALAGKTNTEIFKDYRGVPVLSSYRPLEIAGMNWVIMSEIDEAEAFSHVNSLRNLLLYTFGVLVVLIIVTSYVVSKRITRPLKHLTGGAKQLAKGNLDATIDVKGKDEIAVLALSFKKMQISIKNLINELKDINQNLENKVEERTVELRQQKEVIEEKNKEIVDSINYAKRLQRAILPTTEAIQEHLADSFILFKPKDIVSGDFYWMDVEENEMLISAVDCTGHGVPGAMVSVVGSNGLTRCVKEFGLREPAKIMDRLVDIVIETFGNNQSDEDVKDGMDMALCNINLSTSELQYAGANNPLWILRKDSEEIEEIKADKQPIGKYEYGKAFTNHLVKLQKGDCVYMFSDGYADQFGGPRGKKMKYKTMKQLLISLRDKPMSEQKEVLDSRFEEWRGDLEQIDDVCVIGLRF